MSKGKARSRAFAAASQAVGFEDNALQAYAGQFSQSWLGQEHLASLTVQTLATRAFGAVQQSHVGKRGRPGFKGRHQLDRVEGKVSSSGIRWILDSAGQGWVEWKGGKQDGAGDLKGPALIDAQDAVVAHGLKAALK
jgi:hypothetical protein